MTALCLAPAMPAFAQAETETINFKEHFDTYLVFTPCAGQGQEEEVWLSGSLHTLFHYTRNADGGVVFKFQSQPQGLSGVGLLTGTKYQGTGVSSSIDVDNSGSYPYRFTIINNYRIIGQGKNNNFMVHSVFHVTMNANGEFTGEVDKFSAECR
jgi:hypothetical protein